MTDLSAAGIRALHPWLPRPSGGPGRHAPAEGRRGRNAMAPPCAAPRGFAILAMAESAGRLRVRAVGDGRSAPPVAAVVGGAERAPGTVCRRRGRPGMHAARGGRVVAAPRGGGHDVPNRP